MFICTLKASNIKFFAAVLAAVTVLISIIVFSSDVTAQTTDAIAAANEKISFEKVKTNEDRVNFLKQFGLDVNETPKEEVTMKVPAEFDKVMNSYNELQRGQVVANTQAMLEGHLVNNVLLFGDGGTGKSATVKSMLFRPGFGDLRLIEVQKEGLAQMPRLIRSLAGRRQKFILFIDDLAFDQDDNTYSIMKTILEGGLERRPANVAIYATSNRRHLVRQSFSDRAGDEVDAFETISEKTALAERFGLRIPYLTMSKADYLALVDHLAARAGVAMSAELLHAQAMTWEIRHAGRTPRTAQQFIASLSLQEKQ